MLPATWKQKIMKKIRFFGGFRLRYFKTKIHQDKIQEKSFFMYSFLLLGKASIEKNPRGQFLWCFFVTWKKIHWKSKRIYTFYILWKGCFKWFLFCYLLHSSQLPLFLRLRNFENQVGRDALRDEHDDQHDGRDDRNDRDVRNDRDDCFVLISMMIVMMSHPLSSKRWLSYRCYHEITDSVRHHHEHDNHLGDSQACYNWSKWG